MLIIGIGYKKNSGKDTLAECIVKEIQDAFILHFADLLKEEVAEACDVTIEEINANKDIFRPILQWWGTEFRRKYQDNDNYWIGATEDFLRGPFCSDPKVIIIPDTRFHNEADWIKSKGGKLIKIVRSGFMSSDNHSSETALEFYDKWDMVVTNNGTKEELLQVARGIINSLIMPNL